MIRKSILIWLLISILAILNAGLREKILNPSIGPTYALLASGIILIVLIFIVSFLLIPKLGKGTSKTYWLIGALWVILTIAFETGVNFIVGNNSSEIVKAYDITTGNLWLLVVMSIGCLPRLVAFIKYLDRKQ